jgi:VIT1/CCC1 family predicted Fe2+/Mn2+ transporter
MFNIEQLRAELREADAEARRKAAVARQERKRRNAVSAAAGAVSAALLLVPLLAAPDSVFLTIASAMTFLAVVICFLIVL